MNSVAASIENNYICETDVEEFHIKVVVKKKIKIIQNKFNVRERRDSERDGRIRIRYGTSSFIRRFKGAEND